MEDEEIEANIHTADTVGTVASVPTLFFSIVYRHDFLYIETGSAVCIWLNSLVYHFAGSYINNAFIYGRY